MADVSARTRTPTMAGSETSARGRAKMLPIGLLRVVSPSLISAASTYGGDGRQRFRVAGSSQLGVRAFQLRRPSGVQRQAWSRLRAFGRLPRGLRRGCYEVPRDGYQHERAKHEMDGQP